MREKAVWNSKLLWVNVLTLIATVLTLLIDTSWIAENAQVVGILVSILTVVNIVLRLITRQEIVFRKAQR